MFAWIREDPDALVVWVADLDDKEALLAADPDVFFTTPHYDGHPIVLVRLDQVDRGEAAELIIDSWRHRPPVAAPSPSTTPTPRNVADVESTPARADRRRPRRATSVHNRSRSDRGALVRGREMVRRRRRSSQKSPPGAETSGFQANHVAVSAPCSAVRRAGPRIR